MLAFAWPPFSWSLRLVRIAVPTTLVLSVLLGLGLTANGQTRIAARIDETADTHPLMPALRVGRKALTSLDDVADYEAIFVKKEFVGGQLIEQHMQIRFREHPFSVRLKFIKPNEGREVLYIEGRNNNNLLVQETGLASLVGPISIDPQGSLAMRHTVHPITAIGVKNMLNRLLDHWLSETGDGQVAVKFYPNARIGQTECRVVEATHPAAGRQDGYHKIRLYIDKSTGMPIRVQTLGFPSRSGGKEPVIADYAYLSLKTNIGLTDKHFTIGQ